MNYEEFNAEKVLEKVEARIEEIERRKDMGYTGSMTSYRIEDVFKELSIFDWWVRRITLNHLNQMRTFLKEAIKLGFTGYVCFKVGSTGCANGMWAHTVPTTNGFSPNSDFLYRSFTPAYTYWEIYRDNRRLTEEIGVDYASLKTIKELEKALKEVKNANA